MAEARVNTQELVERIWTEVAAERAVQVGCALQSLPAFDLLIEDDERRYLNEHWVFDRAPTRVESAGFLRGFKSQAKARAGLFVMRVLDRYFDEDQEFRAHLVRLQNKLTDEHDRARTETRDIYASFSREMDRLWQAQATMHAALEERVAALEAAASVTSREPTDS